jgi:hypothetical protein
MNYVQELLDTVTQAEAWLRGVAEADAERRPAPGKWCAKEIIGHLIDSAANNHQRFVRGRWQEELVFPGYEQDVWVGVQEYAVAPWPALLNLWVSYNLHLGRVMRSMPPEIRLRERHRHNFDQLAWRPVAQGTPTTLDYLMQDYVGHLQHHVRQLHALDLPRSVEG